MCIRDRFQVSYIGSRSALGTLPDGALEANRIDDGRVLAASIDASGGMSEAIRRRERHLDPAAIRAFLEVHIEPVSYTHLDVYKRQVLTDPREARTRAFINAVRH